jgi:hypothetical protein
MQMASTIGETQITNYESRDSGGENGSPEDLLEEDTLAFDTAMDMSLQELGIPNRAVAALEKEGVRTVPQILGRMTAGGDQALLSVKGFGPKALTVLKESFRAYGIDIDQFARP